MLSKNMVYTLDEISGAGRKSSPKDFFDGPVIQYDFRDSEKLPERSEPLNHIESKFEFQKQATISITKRSLDDATQGSTVDSSSTCSGRRGGVRIEDAELPSKVLPPWTLALVASLQSGPTSRASKAVPLSLEKQFGWDTLLCTRFGSAWQVAGQHRHSVDVSRLELGEVVKVWSGRQRKLLKVLNVADAPRSALHVGCKNGLACVGTQKGEISLWDVERGTCVSSVCCFTTAVTALFLDSTKGMTFGAMGYLSNGRSALGAWDHRCFKEPIFNWAKEPPGQNPIAGLRCRGHELCIAGGGAMTVLDWRRLSPTMTFSADEVKKSKATMTDAMKEEEENNNACWVAREEEEEDLGDECEPMKELSASKSKSKHISSSGSFMSRCQSLIRSMSFSYTAASPSSRLPEHQLCESIA